jgi:regulator of cell morphogenesis and NO signaling
LSAKFTIHTPINDFIAEDVRRTGVFEELDIDACCGGHRTLAVACAEKGIDPETVLNRLMAYVPENDPVATVVEGMDGSLSEAVDHLLQTHHTFLKEALPRLAALLDKVVDAHVARHPELTTVRELFAEVRADLEPHLMKEEQVLFPMIKQMETSGGNVEFNYGTLQNPIRVMLAEHEKVLTLFERIRATTQNFKMPEDGCESYRLLLTGLDELEMDTRLHIQKENEILFPQVLSYEENMN